MAESTSSTKKRRKKKSKTLSTTIQDSNDIDQRPSLEIELDWCIRQIEIGLLRPKTSSEQKREAGSLIKKLSSSKTPLPKKRQLMHTHFGNYRQKMKEQPLSSLPAVNLNTKPSLSVEKAITTGIFHKQCLKTNTSSNAQTFTFDFEIDNTSS